jgi:hypothetical protein
MSEQAKRDKQAVIDAVIGGDLAGLALALKRLSDSSPSEFLGTSHDLLNTEQHEQFLMLGPCRQPDVYHADGMVFGATYTNGDFLCKRAHPAGTGLPFDEVRQAVEKARAEFEQSVMNVVCSLGNTMEHLDKMLVGHSFADSKLVSLACDELATAPSSTTARSACFHQACKTPRPGY